MPDQRYQLNGTFFLRRYIRNNGIDENLVPRLAGAINVPRIHFGSRNGGQSTATFTRVLSEAQAQSLATLLGTTVANLKSPADGTESILTQLP